MEARWDFEASHTGRSENWERIMGNNRGKIEIHILKGLIRIWELWLLLVEMRNSGGNGLAFPEEMNLIGECHI